MNTREQRKYVQDYEGSGPVVILLHGFLASSTYWRRLQPILSMAGYRVIAIDLLGFGFAPKPKQGAYDYPDHVQHITDAIAECNIHEPFILVGHSMGALIALRFAREHTSQVKQLVLLHPPLFSTADEASHTLRSTGQHYRFLLDSQFRSVAWGIIRMGTTGRFKMRHTKQSREKSLKQIVLKPQGLVDLENVETSTLVVLGTLGRKVYIKNIESIQLKPYISVVLKPVAHHSPTSHPQLIFELIHEFVS